MKPKKTAPKKTASKKTVRKKRLVKPPAPTPVSEITPVLPEPSPKPSPDIDSPDIDSPNPEPIANAEPDPPIQEAIGLQEVIDLADLRAQAAHEVWKAMRRVVRRDVGCSDANENISGDIGRKIVGIDWTSPLSVDELRALEKVLRRI